MGSSDNDTGASHGFPMAMRTGLGGSVSDSPQHKVFIRRAMALASVVVTRAATTAAMLSDHAGRDTVTVEDVQHSLKHHGMTILRSPGLETEVDEFERLLFDSDDDDTTDSGDSGDSGDTTDTTDTADSGDTDMSISSTDAPPSTPIAEPTTTECDCELCRDVADSVSKWDTWEPDDPADAYIRHVVEQSILKANGEV